MEAPPLSRRLMLRCSALPLTSGAVQKITKKKNLKRRKGGTRFILTVHTAGSSELLFQSLLTTADFKDSSLTNWTSCIRSENTRYRGLFPRAWREIEIPEFGLTLICEQVSPVIPHNYEDTSFPVCNFHWTVINTSGNEYVISLTFTFRNGTGNKKWEREGECRTEYLQTTSGKGMKLIHSINSMPTTFAIAAEQVNVVPDQD
ncbi:hypothetical protein ANCDUO_18510 [Ancylostoma duodenale]|uniref:Glycosyl-hydrolase family 116 N-terminal domain-containing protein n=1 Tax=Ancylostoma duodenale TaxID=51022 RepID=A0A0C2FXQ5_9BILA|nr:hypothetical protein ANCDUO_18510 [Ancylostoma duodenale]